MFSMIVFWLLCLLLRPIFGLGLSCCHKAEFHMCRKACLKLGKSNHDMLKANIMLYNCPADQVSFWICMRKKLQKKDNHVSSNFKRGCCSLAVSNKCYVACDILENKDSIVGFCSSTKDVELLKCINKHEMFERCCGATKVRECKDACHEVIMSKNSPSFKLISSLHNECQTSHETLHCIESFAGFSEVLSGNNNFSSCCKEGRSAVCRKKCKFAFSQKMDDSKLVQSLLNDCGYPFPQVGLYQCLFEVISKKTKSQQRSIEDSIRGPNIIESQCCSRAKSMACKSWCKKVFSKLSVIGHSDPMYAQCMTNPSEYGLSTCIEDVLEPCKYGCEDEMKFCSNFNNRPSELFRRCDIKADKAAQKIYNNWKNGEFVFLSVKIPLKNITDCNPEMWKALACSIVVKPCSRKTNRNQICRSDCVSLLNKCMNQEDENSRSAEETCMMLLPNSEQSDCISALQYVNAEKPIAKNKVTFPCRKDPCKINEVCSINEDCSYGKKSPNCRMYSCEPGCSVGGSTNIKIRQNNLAKVLLADRIGQCFAVCQCLATEKGLSNTYALSNCIDFGCNQHRSCLVNQTKRDHNSRFKIGCNFCSCFDGELLCTNRSCENRKDLLCGCEDISNPICGFNGITYPNLCFARCAGLIDSQLKPGDCTSINQCSPNPCPSNMRCLQRRRVCLLSNFFCPQYDCVENTEIARESCEVAENGNFDCKLCSEQNHPCTVKCNAYGAVCGLDGVTYKSRCEASNHMVPVDYQGPCFQLTNHVLHKKCDKAICQRNKVETCKYHIPVDGCCPICEPYLRVLYSQTEAQRHIRRISSKPLIVEDVVKQLSNLIYVSECTVRGYLSKDGDIIIIIKSNLLNGNQIQKEICERETDKLAGMMNERSPILSTNYHLSIAKAAFVQYPSSSQSNKNQPTFISLFIIFIVDFLFALFGYIH